MKLHQQLLASAALLAFAAVAQAQTVSVTPSITDVKVGDSFSVDIAATGFPDKIFGGGYNLAFDPSVLQLSGITIPASWEFATSTGTLDAAAGTVTDVFFNTFVAPVKGDFLTASVQFKAIGAGTSSIAVSESGSFPFGNELGNAVAVTYVNGTVNVAAVPEPTSLAMLLAGLGCVGALARRRQG
jgi:hypothetical protein